MQRLHGVLSRWDSAKVGEVDLSASEPLPRRLAAPPASAVRFGRAAGWREARGSVETPQSGRRPRGRRARRPCGPPRRPAKNSGGSPLRSVRHEPRERESVEPLCPHLQMEGSVCEHAACTLMSAGPQERHASPKETAVCNHSAKRRERQACTLLFQAGLFQPSCLGTAPAVVLLDEHVGSCLLL